MEKYRNFSLFIILISTPDFPHVYYMLGGNLGSLLYGDVSVMWIFSLVKIQSRPQTDKIRAKTEIWMPFLAHLSRRLTGELIGYPWIRRPSSSVVRQRLLLQNRLVNQTQILCGASLERGNESLYKWSRSHDQDGRHAHIW